MRFFLAEDSGAAAGAVEVEGLSRARSYASRTRGFVTSFGARGALAKMVSSSLVNKPLRLRFLKIILISEQKLTSGTIDSKFAELEELRAIQHQTRQWTLDKPNHLSGEQT
jgi:hypothetical protein